MVWDHINRTATGHSVGLLTHWWCCEKPQLNFIRYMQWQMQILKQCLLIRIMLPFKRIKRNHDGRPRTRVGPSNEFHRFINMISSNRMIDDTSERSSDTRNRKQREVFFLFSFVSHRIVCCHIVTLRFSFSKSPICLWIVLNPFELSSFYLAAFRNKKKQ